MRTSHDLVILFMFSNLLLLSQLYGDDENQNSGIFFNAGSQACLSYSSYVVFFLTNLSYFLGFIGKEPKVYPNSYTGSDRCRLLFTGCQISVLLGLE